MSYEKIGDVLQECIKFLGRIRDLHDENEKMKDIEFVQERFEDAKPELISAWTSIIIVNKVHGMPDEYIKSLMIIAYSIDFNDNLVRKKR